MNRTTQIKGMFKRIISRLADEGMEISVPSTLDEENPTIQIPEGLIDFTQARTWEEKMAATARMISGK